MEEVISPLLSMQDSHSKIEECRWLFRGVGLHLTVF